MEKQEEYKTPYNTEKLPTGRYSSKYKEYPKVIDYSEPAQIKAVKECCKNCNKRVLGCHATCEDYKAFKKYRETLRDKALERSKVVDYDKHKVKRRK